MKQKSIQQNQGIEFKDSICTDWSSVLQRYGNISKLTKLQGEVEITFKKLNRDGIEVYYDFSNVKSIE